MMCNYLTKKTKGFKFADCESSFHTINTNGFYNSTIKNTITQLIKWIFFSQNETNVNLQYLRNTKNISIIHHKIQSEEK